MNVMLLAAGRGERMRPLTDKVPKPLVKVGEHRLIEWHLLRLARLGFKRIVINVSYLGEQVHAFLGNGENYGVEILYSVEDDEPLETGGGIARALPMLGSDPFLVINSDILTDFRFDKLRDKPERLMHLVLVNNPLHNPEGDFAIRDGMLKLSGEPSYTFSGIGVYHPSVFRDHSGRFSVVPLIHHAARRSKACAELHTGLWLDVGTKDRLLAARDVVERNPRRLLPDEKST